MPGPLHSAELQLRAARRILRRGGLGAARLGRLDDRLVFVVGSPRSGTTFLGRSLGSLPGFIDLGEVAPHKAAVPVLAGLPPEEAAARMRRVLTVTRLLGLVGRLRSVEQTPETAFVLEAARRAFPEARFVHALRDGRDVVCSLLERGWLRAGRRGADDTGHRFGPEARFWVCHLYTT
ncbi:MAG: sulfotransferase family protein, partial [Gaiellaceae bacterium]